ncbi:MAG: Hexapeptide repeat-containing transferase [Candidatus Magasanikbacteria bacterium GW2011_GWC2_34_16]|uniref:Hexapeptide repeat-containing transferase n=1 Tax=Candidatus Magasanikbacteria bacterium GW2011_GWC2_34_16 TaxID=1619045 RepID=A0A0G0AQE5_9BACT|nr:MAG: Hexapeptide repeat-containing transferase [Candidatus Magasanikbacteria bacterium GW2011_GWC2_34_16]
MDSFYSADEIKAIGFKAIGENVKISRKTSIYGAEYISIGSNVRIDDFCCLVANNNEIIIGSNIHIAFFCILMGSGGIIMEDFSGLSSRVSIYSATDDYSGLTLTNPTIPEKYKHIYSGKVVLRKHVIIGTNTTILPNLEIGVGCSIGANSLVTKSLDEWGIYIGTPVKKLKDRHKDLLKLEYEFSNEQTGKKS